MLQSGPAGLTRIEFKCFEERCISIYLFDHRIKFLTPFKILLALNFKLSQVYVDLLKIVTLFKDKKMGNIEEK